MKKQIKSKTNVKSKLVKKTKSISKSQVKKIVKNELVKHHFSYKKLLFFFVVIIAILIFSLSFFNHKVYKIESNNICEIKEMVSANMKQIEPIRSDFLYLGGEQEHQIKNYLCGEIELIDSEGVRIWGNVFNPNQTKEEKRNDILKELKDLKSSDSNLVVIVCSEEEYDFCLTQAEKAKKEFNLIIVKSYENMEDFELNAFGEFSNCAD